MSEWNPTWPAPMSSWELDLLRSRLASPEQFERQYLGAFNCSEELDERPRRVTATEHRIREEQARRRLGVRP